MSVDRFCPPTALFQVKKGCLCLSYILCYFVLPDLEHLLFWPLHHPVDGSLLSLHRNYLQWCILPINEYLWLQLVNKRLHHWCCNRKCRTDSGSIYQLCQMECISLSPGIGSCLAGNIHAVLEFLTAVLLKIQVFLHVNHIYQQMHVIGLQTVRKFW